MTHLVERFIATVTYVLSFFSLSGIEHAVSKPQSPLFGSSVEIYDAQPTDGPVFKPPTGRSEDYPGGDLVCDYSLMGADWEPCSTPENRGCWLRNKKTLQEYNIATDYEDLVNGLPTGIHRDYYLNLSDGAFNTDGQEFKHGKFFWNFTDPASKEGKRYPGPFVQGCWGDTLHIHVYNDLKFNGTSVHWHGIQQENSFEADGVPGITQCPIRPKDSFTYIFRATQYGSSWYHSHFSLQYADGAAGPMTLHGPSSDNWDEPKFPFTMTDWGHNSGFQAVWEEIGLGNQSILLNGRGDVTRFQNSQKNTSEIPQPHSITVSSSRVNGRPMRYLLRLINISFESHFVFTIDNHYLTVISTDFVPIHPYNTTNVRIGIGQRYNAILIAEPVGSAKKSFWIRTYRPNCFQANTVPSEGYEKTGIVFYDDETEGPDENARGWLSGNPPTSCRDEPYENLTPVVPWTIDLPTKSETDLDVVTGFNKRPHPYPLVGFSIGGEDFKPMLVNYSAPMILNLTWTKEWNENLVVFPENYTTTDWVYLLLRGSGGASKSPTGHHPIHLHGHDFAILAESNQTYPHGTDIKIDNPPRRDVVMLPSGGWVLIAFRTDNPGAWIMHCHIAAHASFGLALQVLERQESAHKQALDSGAIARAQETCHKWNEWYDDCRNWWYDENQGQKPGEYCDCGDKCFSPDSGV